MNEYKAPQAMKDGTSVSKKDLSNLENNAKYLGEWTSSGSRHGWGTQVWSDGSMYQG
jgi:hypothetical protein